MIISVSGCWWLAGAILRSRVHCAAGGLVRKSQLATTENSLIVLLSKIGSYRTSSSRSSAGISYSFPKLHLLRLNLGTQLWKMPAANAFHETDFVLLHTGFVQDVALFELAGVAISGENKVPNYDPETKETNVPGLYVAGTAAAGTQKRYQLFIENCHEHVGKIIQHLTGSWPGALGTIAVRKYSLGFEEFQDN